MAVMALPRFSMLAAIEQLLNRSFEPLFTLYVYMLVLLPSGSLFGVNVKVICFALLVPSTLLLVLHDKKASWAKAFFMLAIPFLLSMWIVIGQLYTADATLSLSEYKDIFSTIASCWLASAYCDRSTHAPAQFLRTVLFAEVLACVLKVGIIAYCAAHGVAISVIVDQINTAFGVKLMGMDLESSLGRVQFIADFLIPICMFMLLRYRKWLKIGTLTSLLMFALLVSSLVFTFSRFLWAFGAAAFLLGLVAGKKDKFYSWTLILIGAITIALFPLLSDLYLIRFSSSVAGASDSVRTDQIVALINFFWQAPFFGSGLGAHTNAVIRSVELPYVYEVQIYALAGQLGLVGLALLILLALVYFLPVWSMSGTGKGQRVNLTILLLIWMTAGFTNPVLLSSAAAMSYATLRALGQLSRESEIAT